MSSSASSTDLKTRSPTLTRLLKTRLAPIRERQLLQAARDGLVGEARPQRPGADECCGSACKPCVMDHWREEVRVWRECVQSLTEEGGAKEGAGGLCKVPGAFEW